LTVCVRSIIIIMPSIDALVVNDPALWRRLSNMVISIMESSDNHPIVLNECLALFERQSRVQRDVSSNPKSTTNETTDASVVPSTRSSYCFNKEANSFFGIALLRSLDPPHTLLRTESRQIGSGSCGNAIQRGLALRLGALKCLRKCLTEEKEQREGCTGTNDDQFSLFPLTESSLHTRLFVNLDFLHGRTQFSQTLTFLPVAALRQDDQNYSKQLNEVKDCVKDLLKLCYFLTMVAPQAGSLPEGGVEEKIELENIKDEHDLFHWFLFVRYVMSGVIGKSDLIGHLDDDTDNFGDEAMNITTTAAAVELIQQHTISRAAKDASLIFAQIMGYPRWPTKVQAAKYVSGTLLDMREYEENMFNAVGNWKNSPNFSPTVARVACLKKCRQYKKTSPTGNIQLPISYLSLHVESLVISACASSTATAETAELLVLQFEGLQFLTHLVWHFGDVLDESDGSSNPPPKILQPLSSQIVSSVSHALGSCENASSGGTGRTTPNTFAQRLYVAGCDLMLLLLLKGLLSESAFRRLLRMVLPSELLLPTDQLLGNDKSSVSLPFQGYPSSEKCVIELGLRLATTSATYSTNKNEPSDKATAKENTGVVGSTKQLPLHFEHICRVGVLARLRMSCKMSYSAMEEPAMSSWENLLLLSDAKMEESLGLHSAALAIDSARINCDKEILLPGDSDNSLAKVNQFRCFSSTIAEKEEDEDSDSTKHHSKMCSEAGLTYTNIDNLDTFSKQLLMKFGPSLAAFAITSLLEVDEESPCTGDDNGSRKKKDQWVLRTITVMLSYLHDALDNMSVREQQLGTKGTINLQAGTLDIVPDESVLVCLHGLRSLLAKGSDRLSLIFAENEVDDTNRNDDEKLKLSSLCMFNSEMSIIVERLYNQIIQPLLNHHKSSLSSCNNEYKDSREEPVEVQSLSSSLPYPFSKEILKQACNFVQDMVKFHNNYAGEGDSQCYNSLQKCILLPLSYFQEGLVSINSAYDGLSMKENTIEMIDIVMASSLQSATLLFDEGRELGVGSSDGSDTNKREMTFSMIGLSLDIWGVHIIRQEKEQEKQGISKTTLSLSPSLTAVLSAVSSLFKNCLDSPLLDDDDKCAIACRCVGNYNWEAWKHVLELLKDGSGLVRSMPDLIKILNEFDHPYHQMSALTTVRSVLQNQFLQGTNAFNMVLRGMGPQFMFLLQSYGSLSDECSSSPLDLKLYRATICAEAIRMNIFIFQCLSEGLSKNIFTEESLVSYLGFLLNVMVSVIDYNGLPNNVKSHSASDPAIGRLCAQTILHFAKTSSSFFKMCLVAIESEKRTIIETAVRSEMSGYAVAGTVRIQTKKLNFKAFKS